MSGRFSAILTSLSLVGGPLAIYAAQTPATPAPAGTAQAPAVPGQPAPAAAPARGRGAPPPFAVVGKTMAVADLMTPEGLTIFNGQWKVSGVKIIEAPAYPKAPPTVKTTYDIEPHANVANFDDSAWEKIEPKGLGEFRGGGKVSFFWYRTYLTMPEMVGTVKVARQTGRARGDGGRLRRSLDQRLDAACRRHDEPADGPGLQLSSADSAGRRRHEARRSPRDRDLRDERPDLAGAAEPGVVPRSEGRVLLKVWRSRACPTRARLPPRKPSNTTLKFHDKF